MKKRLVLAAAVVLPAAFSALSLNGGPAPAIAKPAAAARTAPAARPLLLTGVVDTADSQPILVPPSNSSPVVLRTLVEDGATVKQGDVVLRIETQEEASVRLQRIEADQAKARAEKETADLEVRAVEAERTLATARAALAKAKIDAALPKSQISALDYDRYQGERERAARDLEVQQAAAANAHQAVARRRADAELEAKKLAVNLAFTEARQQLVQVRASRDGIVVHGYSEWRGERYDEGSSAFPGNAVAQVVGDGKMRVLAYALEADRSFIMEGQAVTLSFDALPGRQVTGRVSAIGSAPQPRAIWGNGRYFRVTIELPDEPKLALCAGMSVLVEATPGAQPAPAPAAAAELHVEGEIASRSMLPVSPPTISDVWQYKLGSLAPEGSLVKAGQPIATFQAGEVDNQLESRSGTLKEKQSALAKIKLDHADSERNAELAVAEAQSNDERAQRKAMQPKELIRRIDYDKLVIERGLAGELAALAVQQRDAQARARKAEVAAISGEIAQQTAAIAELSEGKRKLTVLAARDGMVLYRPQFNGEKFTVGSQVWMGLSVANLADPGQLIVQAKVPEAQAASVQLGQRAKVTVPGSNLELSAKVSALGRTYHGKSKSQPVVVRDVELVFDSTPKDVKPGAAVQVSLAPMKGKAQ